MNGTDPQSAQDGRPTFAELMIIPRVLAFTVEVFLHTRMGVRYAGAQSVAALILLLFYAAMWQEHDPAPMLAFMALFFAMCVRNRFEVLRNYGKLPRSHSRYSGYPRLMRWVTRKSETEVKQVDEPLLVLLLGFLLSPLSVPLGVYLMLASGSLALSVLTTTLIEREEMLDLNDLLLEYKERAERFRRLRDDDEI
ncbi:hypothetical protein [Tautonia rosea]|uniref:hypothetical protein n=1 Tax=Tautonia rosea TaxID=2728037 RepID=UPI0014734C07|nr:hypothetical protein [Tautonia rosea]